MPGKRDAGLTRRERKKTVQRSGDDGWEAPPVPIPNTTVKLPRVESTGLEAAWEDRLLPVRDEAPVLHVRGLLLCENKFFIKIRRLVFCYIFILHFLL